MRSNISQRQTLQNNAGFSLVESLITLLIVGIGIQGLVSMQITGMKSNQGAYYKTQASLLASDIVDRLRFNSTRAIAGAYDGFNTQSNPIEKPACVSTTTGCDSNDLVSLDMAEWAELFSGGESGINLIPNGQGTITRGNGNLFTITITWDETGWNELTQRKAVMQQTYSVNMSL